MQRRSTRIQTTITLAFAALVIITAVVLAGLSLSFTHDAVESTSIDYTGQLISQVTTNIDSYIRHMTNIASVVLANGQVQEYFAGRTTGTEREDLGRSIESFLNAIARTRNDISLILIGREDGVALSNRPDLNLNPAVSITDLPFFVDAINSPGEAAISSSHVQNIAAGDYRWVISLSRTVDGLPADSRRTVLLVDLTFSVINDLVNSISLGSRGYLFVVDETGSIVYHPRQELIYSGIETEFIDRVLATDDDSFAVEGERGTRVYTIGRSEQTDWRIVGVNYSSELVQNRTLTQRYYTISSLILVLFAIVISVLISHRVSQPILRLRESMKQVERGEFDRTVAVSASNEVGALAHDYNIMIAKIRELMRRNEEEHALKRKSELLALQNQITPHFLYNTLDSIIWMAEGKQYQNVVTTVSALARLLRLSISKGDELISVHDEIEHIKSYLTIQKVRYRDRLDFSIDVSEGVLRLRIPKVILQPLVENAIYHGIKNTDHGGRVTIHGEATEAGILLSVIDDGVGMEADQMQRILTDEMNERQPGRGGQGTRVGVRNVHERIRLYFGAPYGLTFSPRDGGGTIVRIQLPSITGEALEAVREAEEIAL